MKSLLLPTLSLAFVVSVFSGCASAPTQESFVGSSLPDAAKTYKQAEKNVGFLSKALHAIGVGKPALDKPTQLKLSIFTAKNQNAGAGKKPLSVMMKAYLLTSPEKFNELPLNTFMDEDALKKALGDTLVMQREMMLEPGHLYVTNPTLPAKVRYIGFVSLFKSPAPRRWRFVYNVRASKKSGITLGVHACALSSTAGALINTLMSPADSLAAVACSDLNS